MKTSFYLTDDFSNESFQYKGKTYTVNMAFDNILLLFEMFDDEYLDKIEKPFIGIEMLVNENISEFESYEEGIDVFKYLMKTFLDIDLDNEQGNGSIKVYDFRKDADLIYASFYATYKIDLFEMQGKLHWKKFMALLLNLDDESKFKQVVGFRTMKVPNEKHTSAEYRKHVIKMKQLYSLEDEKEKTEEKGKKKMNDTFDKISNLFKQ